MKAIVGELSGRLAAAGRDLEGALPRRPTFSSSTNPRAVLTPPEADALFDLLRALEDNGQDRHSHHPQTAGNHGGDGLRLGDATAKMVASLDTAVTSPPELAELMVGRRVLLRVEKAERARGEKLLEVDNLSVIDSRGVLRVANASFTVHAGEIVGIAGVSGNGQSELLEAIAGMRQPVLGRIRVDGRDMPAKSHNPHLMRKLGLSACAGGPLAHGLGPPFPAFESAVLGFADDPKLGRGPLLSHGVLVDDLAAKMEHYDVRPQAPRLKTSKFSGGNQQKMVLAREIERAS